jgi:hypothetical protein
MAYLNCQSGLTNTSVTQHCYTPAVHLRKVDGGDELRFMGANARFGMCTATHPHTFRSNLDLGPRVVGIVGMILDADLL